MAASIVAGVDLDAVRTFVAIADAGRFQDAATELSITQQAVSKRVAALERAVGVRLFARTPARGGADRRRAGVPAARAGSAACRGAGVRLRAARAPGAARRRDRARARPGRAAAGLPPGPPRDRVGRRDAVRRRRGRRRDPLRHGRRVLPRRHHDRAQAPRRHRGQPRLRRTRSTPHRPGPCPRRRRDRHPGRPRRAPDLDARPRPGHRVGRVLRRTRRRVRTHHREQRAGLRGGAAARHHCRVAFAGDVRGEQTRLVWPAHHDLRRIAVRNPTPVYPHSLVRHRDNRHPALAALRDHLGAATTPDQADRADAETWTPAWA